MASTERESDRRRREEKWQTLWCCRDQQRACRMAQASAEKLEHTGPAEKERMASVPQRESSRQECRSRPCQKEKEQSRLSKAPDHERGESQGGREPHLVEREGRDGQFRIPNPKDSNPIIGFGLYPAYKLYHVAWSQISFL